MTKIGNQLSSAPLLVEIYRGFDRQQQPIIERVHHGIIVIKDGLGRTIFSQGDASYRTHLRSCAKPFQILPLLETGFFDDHHNRQRYHLQAYDPVLMMSSHSGEPFQTERVANLLASLGLDHRALLCGISAPQDMKTACALMCKGERPSGLHNNCSGKHLAMVIACLQLGFDPHTFDNLAHPLQQLIRESIATVADLPIDQIEAGIDGCSLPSYVVPMENLALMYARLSSWSHGLDKNAPAQLAKAMHTIWHAIVAYPEYLAGHGRFDTDLIRTGGQRIISKSGVDGIIGLSIAPCAEFPHGLGIAIKIADGDAKQNIRALVVKELLSPIGLWPTDKDMEKYLPPSTNFRGITTGGTRCHINFKPN